MFSGLSINRALQPKFKIIKYTRSVINIYYLMNLCEYYIEFICEHFLALTVSFIRTIKGMMHVSYI